MQYTEMFKVLKNEKIQKKSLDIFLIFAQNVDCGYTLEPPRRSRGPGLEPYKHNMVSLSKNFQLTKVLFNYPGSGGSVPT